MEFVAPVRNHANLNSNVKLRRVPLRCEASLSRAEAKRCYQWSWDQKGWWPTGYLMLAALSSAKVDSHSGSLKIELESCV